MPFRACASRRKSGRKSGAEERPEACVNPLIGLRSGEEGSMDQEKHATRKIDGVDVPHMGVRELIGRLEEALRTMEGNRRAYVLPEEIEAARLMVGLFGNSLYYMRVFEESLRRFEAMEEAMLEEQLRRTPAVGGVC